MQELRTVNPVWPGRWYPEAKKVRQSSKLCLSCSILDRVASPVSSLNYGTSSDLGSKEGEQRHTVEARHHLSTNMRCVWLLQVSLQNLTVPKSNDDFETSGQSTLDSQRCIDDPQASSLSLTSLPGCRPLKLFQRSVSAVPAEASDSATAVWNPNFSNRLVSFPWR